MLIEYIFEMKSGAGRLFADTLTFEDASPEFKNISLETTFVPRITSGSSDCPDCIDRSVSYELFEISVKKAVATRHPADLKLGAEEATREAERFRYVFSAAADLKFYDFALMGYRIEGRMHPTETLYPKRSEVSARATVTHSRASDAVSRVKAAMKEDYDLSRIALFYDAASVVDPVARFISLYTVMLAECSRSGKESQSSVDEAILAIDETVIQFKNDLRGRIVYETVFTKLRNDLSHSRKDTNVLKTHHEVERYVDKFERIVRAHMLGGPLI